MGANSRGRAARVIYVAVGHLSDDHANTNFSQRVMMAPKEVDLTVIVRRGSKSPRSLPSNVTIRRAWLPGLPGFYLEALAQLAGGLGRRADVVVTDRSAVSMIGWALRGASAYRWIVDLWDVPHKELVSDYPARRGLRGRLRRTASRAKVAGLRYVIRRADLVLASVLPEVLAPYRVDAGRLKVFAGGIDLSTSPSEEDAERIPRSICYVTSVFLPDRGVDVLLAAVEDLHRNLDPAPMVTLMGSIPPDLHARIDASPAAASFKLAGTKSISAASDLMRRSQVGVIPFHYNEDLDGTYPIKLYEYMALGCVVVASDLRGIRSIVGDDGAAAILVDPGDPGALARGLREALADPDKRRQLQRVARQRVLRFDAREKVRLVYEALLEYPDSPARRETWPPPPADR